MAETAQQLITKAFYLSGVVSRGLETLSNDQLYDGLDLLNEALDSATSNNELIPYWTVHDFTMAIGQGLYPIDNLIQVETVTFFIEDVRYPMQEATREQFYATSRVTNITTLPYQWHFEAANGVGNLSVYYLPQENYAAQLTGKFQLQNVTFMTDMSATYSGFYLRYLRYKLASLICEYYNVVFAPPKQDRLRSYEQSIKNVSPLDLTMRKVSAFQTQTGMDIYAQANLGRGWYP